jgi:hypothetical protein
MRTNRKHALTALVAVAVLSVVGVGAAQAGVNSAAEPASCVEEPNQTVCTVPNRTTTATVTATATQTVTQTVTATPSPTETTTTPTDPPTTNPPPVVNGSLPYTADSFFKSRAENLPIDQAKTDAMHAFMKTDPDQKAISWPKINLNPGWSGHNYVYRSGMTAPVWRLAVGSGGGNSRLDIVETQGVHISDSVWDTVPTGTQDRLLVVQDHVFGYTVQCADVAPNRTARTWTASNCGIFWHSSNGLDYRNPKSNDQRNISSRGRIIDSMQVPRAELDAAVSAGTGVGHVLHLFWVSTEKAMGFSHPMVGAEGNTGGWGGEGWRLRLNPTIDLQARGLTGATLALARTLQQNGAYIGDNSGSSTQIKVGPPGDYTGTNLATDAFKGKITWDDFQVVTPGAQ